MSLDAAMAETINRAVAASMERLMGKLSVLEGEIQEIRGGLTRIISNVETGSPSGFLRIKEVCLLTGLSRSTIYKLMNKGEFPKRKQISDNSVAWAEAEVLAWIESRERVGKDG